MANFDKIVPFTLNWEGGLSRSKADKTAAKNPAPYTYKGYSDWHTNKGIVWPEFKRLAPKYGYAVNASNWFTMPQDLWNKIAKNNYWDKMQLDRIKSDAVAFYLFQWFFMAGYNWVPRMKAYLATKGINYKGSKQIPLITDFVNSINQVIDKQGAQKTADELHSQMQQYFESLTKLRANLPGWINRLNDLKKYIAATIFLPVAPAAAAAAPEKKNSSAILVLITLAIVGTGIYFANKKI